LRLGAVFLLTRSVCTAGVRVRIRRGMRLPPAPLVVLPPKAAHGSALDGVFLYQRLSGSASWPRFEANVKAAKR
jgi:hypothetical protein